MLDEIHTFLGEDKAWAGKGAGLPSISFKYHPSDRSYIQLKDLPVAYISRSKAFPESSKKILGFCRRLGLT